jgi:Family of unknown function (DUF5343)
VLAYPAPNIHVCRPSGPAARAHNGRDYLVADFPYVLIPNKIGPLFDQLRKVNKPSKVTQTWLQANGFTSKNDRALIGLLKALEYVDGSGAPTSAYNELKGSDDHRRTSIGRQMAIAYKDVFDQFPVDHISGPLTREELSNFIRPKVSAGAPTVRNIVSTFFALRSLAKFDGQVAAAPPAPALQSSPISAPGPAHAPEAGTMHVTINLSLEIPPTADADVYDKLFAAMAKHLGGMLKRES